MTINLEMVAREYTTPQKAEFYFKNCIYNGSIKGCIQYLQGREKVAEHNKDNEFIQLVKSMVWGGLVGFSKNAYNIRFLTTNTGTIANAQQHKLVNFIRYDNNTIAYDYPYQVPKYIKEYLQKIINKGLVD